jgi:hypothetical protein
MTRQGSIAPPGNRTDDLPKVSGTRPFSAARPSVTQASPKVGRPCLLG